MCGRYQLKNTQALRQYALEFGIPEWVLERPNYNVAPSQSLPVFTMGENGAIVVTEGRWGLVPFWDKTEKPKFAPINARSEEAFAKPMFRQSIQKRRCLVPADGFYEWKRIDEKTKIPFDIHLKGNRPFVFAGIYEAATTLRPPTYALLTRAPNELMATIHDRMPVIMEPDAAKRWVAPGEITADQFEAFTLAHPASDMEAIEISALVGNVRNNGPEVLFPAAKWKEENGPMN